VADLRLAEFGFDPDLMVVNQREGRRTVIEIIADLQVVDLGRDAVGRRVTVAYDSYRRASSSCALASRTLRKWPQTCAKRWDSICARQKRQSPE
jgi:hypothetical protein